MVSTTHVKFSEAFPSIAHVFAVQRSSPHEGSILLDVPLALFLVLRPVLACLSLVLQFAFEILRYIVLY